MEYQHLMQIESICAYLLSSQLAIPKGKTDLGFRVLIFSVIGTPPIELGFSLLKKSKTL